MAIGETPARGGSLDALVAQLTVEEQRKRDLRGRLDHLLAAASVASLDRAQITREARELAGDVVGLLLSERTPQVRMMLRKLLVGPIVCAPIVVDGRRGYHLSGRVSFAPFLRGEVRGAQAARQEFTHRQGIAPRWWPQRDAIELAELKCAISLRAERVPLELRAGRVAETVLRCLWMVAGARFELWKRPHLSFEFLLDY